MIPCDASAITGLVLAGGQGLRMGGVDKGLQDLRGAPLARHALRRLQTQSRPLHALAINANRNPLAYAALGVPVWPDHVPDPVEDFAGPLAGFLSGMQHCTTPLLLTVPCDTPLLPLDLAERLLQAMQAQDAELAMASARQPDGSSPDAQGAAPLRPQPVFCLLTVGLKDSLSQFLAQGGRKVGAWAALHRCALVPFDRESDAPDAFFNANTLPELQRLASG